MGWFSPSKTNWRLAQVAADQAALNAAQAATAKQSQTAQATPQTADVAGVISAPGGPAPVRASTDVEGGAGSSSTSKGGITQAKRSFGLNSTLLVPGGGVYPVVFGDKKTLLGQ